ncbi:hypothetical protein [Polaribacter sp. IC073]|uniref:hypothetical protein n=1 Tax=Polaribacter sp. IC073 TaxID=2508540 RepID=UPI0011BD44B7|nr:hypothetical protein [Polaribacter sp. IC073]TXD47321.1 hypothetical protein ES045_12040 [Polaribacter sp. IC073]
MKDLRELANENNLKVSEITTGSNGYPSGLYNCIMVDDFNSFKEVEEFATTHNLEIIQIHQRDGWSLWENKGSMYKSFENSSEDYGDDYAEFPKMDEAEFIENEVTPLLEDTASFDAISLILEAKKEIWEEIEEMEEGEVVISYQGNYSETIKKHSLSFYHDTHSYAIALINK